MMLAHGSRGMKRTWKICIFYSPKLCTSKLIECPLWMVSRPPERSIETGLWSMISDCSYNACCLASVFSLMSKAYCKEVSIQFVYQGDLTGSWHHSIFSQSYELCTLVQEKSPIQNSQV